MEAKGIESGINIVYSHRILNNRNRPNHTPMGKQFYRCVLAMILFFQSWSISANATGIPYWITATENQSATNTWLCFRKKVILPELPNRAPARIAADSKYWLWINGELAIFEGGVKRGPNPTDTYYDEVDISRYLKKGENTIAIQVWYFGKEGFSYNPSGKAGLFFDCIINDSIPVYSDSSWEARIHPAYFTPGQPYPNFRLSESNIGFDARYDIGDWQKRTDGNKWQNATICGKEGDAPWNKLHHRIIPLWKDSGLKAYEEIVCHPGNETDTIIGILPYNCQITPYLKIDSKREGEKIVMYTDYYKGGGSYNVRGEYITKKGIQSYESLGWMNGQKVYYILSKGIDWQELKYRETSYNTTFAGKLKCSDAFLNRYFEKAKRTLLVTMRDTYMDCPDRERAQWWGDVVIESGESFYALDTLSHLLIKKGMYELIGWQKENGILHSPIPASNYDAELFGQMLASIGYYGFWNYYMNTGDIQTLKALYPGVRKYLKIWSLEDNGLLKLRETAWLWGDWGTNIDKEGLINLWYYLALKGAKNMAEVLGKKEDATEYATMMDVMENAINSLCWTGTCYQHPDFKGNIDERVSALAVVAGIVDKSKYSLLLNTFKNYEYASPYMEKYVMEACFILGDGRFGIERMKKKFHAMVTNKEHSTLFEGWGIGKDGYGGGSTNHAWSGGGLTVFAQYVLGIKPVSAGYDTVSIAPSPSGINDVEMEMSTVKGKMDFSYHVKDGKLEMEINLPLSVNAEIKLDCQLYESIRWNGMRIDTRKKSFASENYSYCINNDTLILYTKGGKHHLACDKTTE